MLETIPKPQLIESIRLESNTPNATGVQENPEEAGGKQVDQDLQSEEAAKTPPTPDLDQREDPDDWKDAT